MTIRQMVILGGVVVVVLVIIGSIVGGGESSSTRDRSAPKPRPTVDTKATAEAWDRAVDQGCMTKLNCAADRSDWFRDADRHCGPLVEDKAKYTMRWTTGFMEMKFDRVAVMPPAHTKLAFVGDKAEFQNGFGAWQRVHYTCIYDPRNELAISVTISER